MEASLADRLMDLGFSPAHPDGLTGDFILQDDSDGRGAYIRAWLSSEPCPFPDEVREPVVQSVEVEHVEHPAQARARIAIERTREAVEAHQRRSGES